MLLAEHAGGYRGVMHDGRDLPADTSGIKIAVEVDPRGEMTGVYDQGMLGSCTANANAAAFDYDRIVNGESPIFPSRLGIYYYERKLEHLPFDQDTGAWGRDGLKAEKKIGVWLEDDWTYSDSTSDKHFGADPAVSLGPAPHRLERPYKAVPRSGHAIKSILSNRQTLLIGFDVYESFESRDVAKSGVMPTPQPGEAYLGGHEVLVVGYLKSEPHHVLVRNSWGKRWGAGGYFLMPWQFLLDPHYTSDYRTIYRPATR